jgi:teichoic acid transport system permease protein
VSATSTSGRDSGLIELGRIPPLRTYIVELWRRRSFAISLSAGEYRAKHANSFLGSGWYLLNPLLQLAVYYLIFGVILQTDRNVDNFIGFLAAGIFIFQYSQRAITGGASSISRNLSLIRSLQFPRALLPISAVLREAMALRIALLAAIAIMLLSGEHLTPWWLLAIPVLLLQTMFNLGGAFIAARLADKVRDLENILPFLFRLAFYGSGVLFLVDRIMRARPALRQYEWLFIANPFYSYISLVRHYTMPSLSQENVELLWLSGASWAIGVFVLGLLFFRAGERTYGRG